MHKKLTYNLSEQQKSAVTDTQHPSIILAGAGSGKTRVLIQKVAHLIEVKQIPPEQIVMITFTNKAAREMKDRIQRLFGSDVMLGYVGTFHSFCAMVLRRDGSAIGIESNYSIYDDSDQQSVIKSIIHNHTERKLTPSYVLGRISAAKNQLITPAKYIELFSDYNSGLIGAIYAEYEKTLLKNQALDFDDLIMKVCQLFMRVPEVLTKYQHRFRYILVDEFQDTNYSQYALTRMLGEAHKQVTVVGDFSQSIYSWRGADIRNLEKFKEDFPETVTYHLEQNYRSTQKILDFAYEVISQNQTHPILKLHTENRKGEDVTYFEAHNEQDEALYIISEIEKLHDDDIPYLESAILYRTNAQSRVIEEALLHRGIPYVLIGGIRFYERKEIKDTLSYLRLVMNPLDDVSKQRIEKIGKRKWQQYKNVYPELVANRLTYDTATIMDKIFVATGYLDQYKTDDPEDYARLENIKELKSVALNFSSLTQFLEQVALVESEYFEGEKKAKKDGVNLMTLHQAKGLEFPTVFITGLEEGILPHARSVGNLFELEEERRLFYVGITRAMRHLYITYTKRRFIFGRRYEAVKSRFIGGNDIVNSTDDWS